MSTSPSPALLARVAALSVAIVFFQIGVVSEVPLFGVTVDLTPKIIAGVNVQILLRCTVG